MDKFNACEHILVIRIAAMFDRFFTFKVLVSQTKRAAAN